MDIQGRVLINRQYKGNEYDKTIVFSVPSLNAGFYWLSLESAGRKMMRKIVLAK